MNYCNKGDKLGEWVKSSPATARNKYLKQLIVLWTYVLSKHRTEYLGPFVNE